MPIYLASLVALVGIAMYVAVHYAWIGLRHRQAGTHRLFSAIAAVLAVCGLTHACFQHDPAWCLAHGSEDVIWLCEMGTAVLMLAFVARFTGQDHRPLRLILSAALLACAGAALILPEGLRSGPINGITTTVMPWGESIHQLKAPYGAAYLLMLSLVGAAFAFFGTATWRAWRAGRSGRQVALLVALALILAAVVNSAVADLTGWRTLPLITHSFILLAAIMGHTLSAELARTSQLEARLRRAEQFAAVGRLAGGVAHDFGNVLTGILGHAELLADQVANSDRAREQAAAIAQAARRGTALTRQMLAFARGSPASATPSGTDVHEVLREVAGLVRSGAAGIEVRLNLAEQPAAVACDPAQLHAALLNLAVNARDAMPHGGVLRLSATHRDPPISAALRHVPTPGPLVEIAVGDSGQGIPASVLPRIFDLQYSTKGALGTGLGLPQVDELVSSAGGCLLVETAAGIGTTFRVWLPLCDHVDSGLRAAHGSQVLLVAGSTSLDQMLSAGLGQLGYDIVHLGQEGTDGLLAAVIDIDHAGSSGLDQVRRLQKNLPLVVLADDPLAWPDAPSTMMLPKPVDLVALGRALRRACAPETA